MKSRHRMIAWIRLKTIYSTLIYISLILSIGLNYAEFYSYIDFQGVGTSYELAAKAKAEEERIKAQAKSDHERMMAAIENPPAPVQLKPMKKGK